MTSTGRNLRSLTTLLRDGGPRLAAFMALLASMAAGAKEAHAGSYSLTDAFDNFAEWSPWTNGCAAFYVSDGKGVPPISRSPSKMGAISCGWDPSQFGILDKVFVEPGPKAPKSCKASVYFKNGSGNPVNFTLQMIDADSWTYIGSASYSFAVAIPAPPPTWQLVPVTNTYGCSRNIDVRISITGSSILGAAPYVLLDDVKVEWFY